MKNFNLQTCIAAVIACGGVSAHALPVTVNFEDLDPVAGDKYFGSAGFSGSYMGFQFGDNNQNTTDWFVSNKFASGGAFNPFNNSDLKVGMSNSCNNPPTQPDCEIEDPLNPGSFIPNPANKRLSQAITRVDPLAPTFQFLSLFASGSLGSRPNLSNHDLIVRLYNSGNIQLDVDQTINVGPVGQTYAINYTGSDVKSFRIFGEQSYYVIDNIVFSPVNLAQVPEPGTYALVLAGLVAFAAAQRRRRQG